MPALPASLVKLDCSEVPRLQGIPTLSHTHITKFTLRNSGQLRYMPTLPQSLEVLVVENMPRLLQLWRPHLLPRNLKELSLSYNTDLHKLPYLPRQLTWLHVVGGLVALRPLPNTGSFQELELSDCSMLRELPSLPASLLKLKCNGLPKLRQLPLLPEQLTHLDCFGCKKLQKLPTLPGSLCAIICSGCIQLTVLPDLPQSLEFLACSGCKKLMQLPDVLTLPNLRELSCDGCKSLHSVKVGDQLVLRI
eukprot:GHUV01029148.1.p1 GENE.GHUV01029148.1~~GHUV01029148.1.p1  ORF type:complete len:249 (+),score=28.95 GHUV01029148.1:1951-2697(+)